MCFIEGEDQTSSLRVCIGFSRMDDQYDDIIWVYHIKQYDLSIFVLYFDHHMVKIVSEMCILEYEVVQVQK